MILQGQKFQILLDRIDEGRANKLALLFRETLLKLRQVQGSFEFMIENIPQIIMSEIKESFKQHTRDGYLTECTMVGDLNDSMVLPSPAAKITLSQDQAEVLKYDKELLQRFCAQLQGQLKCSDKPQITLDDRNMKIIVGDYLDTSNVANIAKSLLKNLVVKRLENIETSISNKYLLWLKENYNLSYLTLQSSKKTNSLKGYAAQTHLIYSFDSNLTLIDKLDDIRFVRSYTDWRQEILDFSFVQHLPKWIPEELLYMIEKDEEGGQIIIGPQTQLKFLVDLIQVEKNKMLVFMDSIKVDIDLSKVYYPAQMNRFAEHLQQKVNNYKKQISIGDKLPSILKEHLNKEYYPNLYFYLGLKMGNDIDEIEFTNSKPLENLLRCLNQKENCPRNEGHSNNYVLSILIICSVQEILDEARRAISQFFTPFCHFISDATLLKFLSNPAQAQLIKKLQRQYAVIIKPSENNKIQIQGHKQEVENLLEQLKKETVQSQRNTIVFNFGSTFVLNVVQKYFQAKLNDIRQNYDAQFQIDDSVIANINVPLLKSELVAKEFKEMKDEIEKSATAVMQINFENYAKLFDDPQFKQKIAQLERKNAVSISLGVNVPQDYNVNYVYNLYDKQIRVCSGSLNYFFSSKKGQNELIDCSIIFPMLMEEDSFERDLNHPIKQLLNATDISENLKQNIRTMVRQKQQVFEYVKPLTLANSKNTSQDISDSSSMTKKQRKQFLQQTKQAPNLYIYYSLYQDMQKPVNFYNYFDKLTPARIIQGVFRQLREDTQRLIIYQSNCNQVDQEIVKETLELLQTLKTVHTVDFMTITDKSFQDYDSILIQTPNIKPQPAPQKTHLEATIRAYDQNQVPNVISDLMSLQ